MIPQEQFKLGALVKIEAPRHPDHGRIGEIFELKQYNQDHPVSAVLKIAGDPVAYVLVHSRSLVLVRPAKQAPRSGHQYAE